MILPFDQKSVVVDYVWVCFSLVLTHFSTIWSRSSWFILSLFGSKVPRGYNYLPRLTVVYRGTTIWFRFWKLGVEWFLIFFFSIETNEIDVGDSISQTFIFFQSHGDAKEPKLMLNFVKYFNFKLMQMNIYLQIILDWRIFMVSCELYSCKLQRMIHTNMSQAVGKYSISLFFQLLWKTDQDFTAKWTFSYSKDSSKRHKKV